MTGVQTCALPICCLSRNRAERPDSARELAALLEEVATNLSAGPLVLPRPVESSELIELHSGIGRKPVASWLALGAMLVLGLAAAGYLLWPSNEPAATSERTQAREPSDDAVAEVGAATTAPLGLAGGDATPDAQVGGGDPVAPDAQSSRPQPPRDDEPKTETPRPEEAKPKVRKEPPKTPPPTPSAPDPRADALVAEAQEAYRSGQLKRARELVDEALGLDPQHREAKKLAAKLAKALKP